MLTGPQGQKWLADTIQTAVKLAKIATGEIEQRLKGPSREVRSGKAGAKAHVEKTTDEVRSAIAKKADGARWR